MVKRNLTSLLRSNSIFLSLSLMLLIALGLALLLIPKGDLHLALCNRHTPARDILYMYYTRVAEWFPYVICVFILLFGRIGDGCMATAAMILSGLTTQLFKHIINAPRPLTWFEQNMPEIQLPLTEGVRMNYWFSFPSGHTTSFFALALVIGITGSIFLIEKYPSEKEYQWRNALMQVTLFLFASLGGYSRIYLSQHFATDIAAGILIGILITLLIAWIFGHWESKKWYNYHLIGKKMH